MSQENVEVVREIYRAFAEHRFPAEHLAEDFVWETGPEQPDAGSYKGHDAVRAHFREWVGGWHQVESNVEKLTDQGDQVVALIHGRYRLSASGEAIEADYAHIWTLQAGKAIHAQEFASQAEALEAAGLRE